MALPDGVECVLAPNPSLMTGPGTNTFVIGRAGASVVIDPGPDIPAHLARVAEAARAHGPLQAILITHGHPDHVEGAAALRRLTGAPVLAWSREGAPEADILLADEQVLEVGDRRPQVRRLRVLHTPGHRFDHLCFLLEDAETIFVGDLVAGVGTVVIIPPEGDLLDYLASLQRLRELRPRQLLPAHGPPIEDPDALVAEYLAHRAERERQVLAGLAMGPATVAALVASIYAEVDPGLHGMAAHSVLAHLLKLEREGRVARARDAEGREVWRLA